MESSSSYRKPFLGDEAFDDFSSRGAKEHDDVSIEGGHGLQSGYSHNNPWKKILFIFSTILATKCEVPILSSFTRFCSRSKARYFICYYFLLCVVGGLYVAWDLVSYKYAVFASLSLLLLFFYVHNAEVSGMTTTSFYIAAIAATNLYVESLFNAFPLKLSIIFTFLSNLFFILFYIPGFCLAKNSVLYTIVVSAFLELYAMAQAYIIMFRGVPMRAYDIHAIQSAWAIKSEYSLLKPRGIFLITFGVVVLYSLYRFSCKSILVPPRKKLRYCAGGLFLVSVFMFAVCGNLIIEYGLKIKAIIKPKLLDCYRQSGCVLYFYLDYMLYQGPTPPPGYSISHAESLLQKYGKMETVDISKLRRPNIFAIMSESYGDFRDIGDLKTNEEFTPYIKTLNTNTVRGHVSVSVLAGLSCNSEFEFLTGNSMSFYTPETCAYSELVGHKQDTIVNYLNKLGYETISLAASRRQLWNIGHVYEEFEFKRSYFRNEFYDPHDLFNGKSTDRALFRGMMDIFKKKTKGTPIFTFMTTMQNHAFYEKLDHPTIVAQNYNNDELNTFLTGLKLSDDALKELIEYLKTVDEDCMVVLFGDHFPYIKGFTEHISGGRLTKLNLEQNARLRATPFIIWTNYNISSSTGEYFGLNYLMNRVIDVLGFPKTPYMRFLDDLKKNITCTNPLGYRDRSGKWYKQDEPSDFSENLARYMEIQHYMINDKYSKK